MTNSASATSMNPDALKALGVPSFDANWYLQQYPDVSAASMDPLQHYLLFGQREGRAVNASDNGATSAKATTPTPQAMSAPLDPSDPASMAAWRQKAHNETSGLNYLPRVAPDPSTLSANAAQTTNQFYPQAQQNDIAAILKALGLSFGGGASSGPTMNLGMGSDPSLAKYLDPYMDPYMTHAG